MYFGFTHVHVYKLTHTAIWYILQTIISKPQDGCLIPNPQYPIYRCVVWFVACTVKGYCLFVILRAYVCMY
jgi:aspartate/methionine/tyrosine aminotransferase